MKQLIIVFIVFSQSFLIAQEMLFNKDSIFIATHAPDDPFDVPEFSSSDFLWLYNNGDSLLHIDSIKTLMTYSYRLKIEFSDSTNYYTISPYLDPFEKHIEFSLAKNDSAKLIFADPDFCPICDSDPYLQAFTDTLYFYNNSQNQPRYDLHTSGDGTSDIKEFDNSNPAFYLNQNFPNPFNPTTNITYSLSTNGFITLKIFNLLGEEVATLVEGFQNAGIHSVKFEAKNISSGIYIYKLNSIENILTKKMILLR